MTTTSCLTKIEGVHKLVIPTPFPVGTVNVYLVQGDAVTLFDIGPKTREAWGAFESQLKCSGFSINDIDQVVLTHHHVDHCGLLDLLMDKCAIPVFAHSLARPWVAQNPDFFAWHQEYFWELYQQIGVEKELLTHIEMFLKWLQRFSCCIELSSLIQEGDEIPGLGEWDIYETPGHSQSHLVFHRERDGVLLGGDHIIKHISSNAILEAPLGSCEQRPRTLVQYRESLVKCKQLGATTVFTGHGEEVYNLSELIDLRLQQQEDRAEMIRKWLVQEPLTPFEIVKRMFPKVYQKELSLTISEVIGHLDLLLDRHQIIHESVGGAKGTVLFRSV